MISLITEKDVCMRSTFKVAFYLKRNALKKSGLMPVVSRITVNGEVSQFSTKLEIAPSLWSVELGRAKGFSRESKEINALLDDIKARLHKLYHNLVIQDLQVSSESLKNEFLGISEHHETLLNLFDKHNEDVKKLVGISKSKATFQKYQVTRNHLADFIKKRYHRSDVSLKEINPLFLTDFEVFLQTTCLCNLNTTAKFMQFLKRIIIIAKNNGFIAADPFINYKIRLQKVDRGYLSEDELKNILQKEFSCKRLEQVRDIFIFSCFTGLAYIDVKNLTRDNIRKSFDGNLWVMTKRQKTNVQCNILLLEIPLKILEKYNGLLLDNRVLPILSNQKMNAYLKEIADICGIDKEISYHLARHTFATTVTLAKGVPIESVSKMLGHTNIQKTQIYARITNEKISKDMHDLSGKLSSLNENTTI